MKQLELNFPSVKPKVNRLQSLLETAEPSERFGMLEIDKVESKTTLPDPVQLDFYDQLYTDDSKVIDLNEYRTQNKPTAENSEETEVIPSKERPISNSANYLLDQETKIKMRKFHGENEWEQYRQACAHPGSIYRPNDSYSFELWQHHQRLKE